MIYFEKNTYQYEIAFRFDCISAQLVTAIAVDGVVSSKHFAMVFKDGATNQTVMSIGDGTEASPIFQMRMASDRIILWGGWFVTLKRWQDWCNAYVPILADLLRGIPLEFVAGLSAQYNYAVPIECLRPGRTIPELEPVRAFYQRFTPIELLSRGNVAMVFSDEAGREALGWNVGGSTMPGHENIGFNHRWLTLEKQLDLKGNVRAHMTRAEELLRNFDEGFLSLVTKTVER